MATYRENINKIRGEAIYGVDVREAIAAAIDQAAKLDVDSDRLLVRTTSQGNDDFLLEIIKNS